MFLESSPCESFIKSSSLSKLELQSFVEEKTKSFWVITSLQSKSFSTPSLSFRRKSSKSFNESFLEETKSFCWSSYYPQEICSYLLDSTKQVFLWRSLSPIFFFLVWSNIQACSSPLGPRILTMLVVLDFLGGRGVDSTEGRKVRKQDSCNYLFYFCIFSFVGSRKPI